MSAYMLPHRLVDGDPEASLAAVDAYRRGSRPFEHALACDDAAEVLLLADRREEAVELLKQSIELLGPLGAERRIARANARLRELGVRPGRRGSRKRPVTGWAALTPTEQRVTELASERLTNVEIGQRLFISKRTVQTHLEHVFLKLGISSRRQLFDHAARGTEATSPKA